jgi:AAA domain
MRTPQSDSRLVTPIVSVPLTEMDIGEDTSDEDWLWHGLVVRGMVTLFTSPPKNGKTTLLTGLMQQFAQGGMFLDRPVAPARVLYVSEESKKLWAPRIRRMPIGEHCRLVSRPYTRRPTPAQWEAVVEHGMELQAAGKLDVMVIDSLDNFLPGATDGDLNAIQQMLHPLRCLTDPGAGVVILHHPRRENSEEGFTARGHGGLLAEVDIIVELKRYGSLRTDEHRRQLFALSRLPETPKRLVYERDPATGRFGFLGDPLSKIFEENWEIVLGILKKRKRAGSHEDLLMDWPADQPRPSKTTLYEWLNRAYEAKLIRRVGAGRRKDPFRYRLENEDDAYMDRGELPPLRLDMREIIG